MATRRPAGSGLSTYLVRAAVFVGAWAVARGAVELLADDNADANIGAGLLAFLAVLVGAAIWGFLDARHGMPLARLALIWVAVGVTLGLAVPVITAVADGDVDAGVIGSDLVGFVPFLTVLVAAPAVAAGLLGSRTTP